MRQACTPTAGAPPFGDSSGAPSEPTPSATDEAPPPFAEHCSQYDHESSWVEIGPGRAVAAQDPGRAPSGDSEDRSGRADVVARSGT